MLYWVIMGLLVVVALGLIIAIVVTLRKNNEQQDEYDYDGYDVDDEYEEYGDEEPEPVRARQRHQEEPESVRARQSRQEEPERRIRESEPRGQGGNTEAEQPQAASQPPKKTKRQWKVILENLDTWEKFSYTFYDNIGIGRSRTDGEFEKFLTIKEDPRISKLHCAILRQEDRLYLMDMGSRNGTYLNGERIYQEKEIQRDDVIRIGETQIEVKKVLRERE